ncbi:MAG TPA: glycosyltransferase family 4 protein [Candidatus Limiplasma sp.]|nr:glycosyltransferase family 4 protein [Candidatus Limiplasma sp.]
MPTLLFVMKYPLHRRDNLQTKFDGQLAAARALGWDAYFIGWDPRGMYLIGNGRRELLRKNRFASLRGYDHTVIFPDLMAAVRVAIRRIPVDVLYLRYMPTFGNAPSALRELKARGGRLVMEYPTYPTAEENQRFFLRRQVFRYTDCVLAKINPMVDLYTVIGEAVGRELNGRPAMNILNGVDVSALPAHAPNPGGPIRLLALASMSGWHGYDRILQSLAAYQGDAEVRIDFVGGDGDGSLAAWETLAQSLGLGGRVAFHGPLYGEALDSVIAGCDIGVGSLGMYRYGLAQGMTLKLREYMARGLPFVSAVDDPSLPEEPAFALRVPNDDTPIDMAQVVAFAKNAKLDADAPARMRAYAQAHMSWQGILGSVLERLKP